MVTPARRPLRVGLNVPIWVDSERDPITTARNAERLGFDFVSVNDHLHGIGARYESWTLMAWMAASTSSLAIASRVLATPYRNPAVLAKMAESFDRLSGGRLILGLGAGASEEEFHAFGIPEAPMRDRMTGLEEAIRIIRGLWTAAPFTLDGAQHRTNAAVADPMPDHAIPIWLGTYGPRGLDLLGRLADGWIASFELAPPEQAPGMLGRIRAGAESAGRDPEAITSVYNLEVSLDTATHHGPSVVSGPPDAVTERLAGFLDLGFNAFNLIVVGEAPDDQAEQLAADVLPALRRQAERA